MTETSIAKSAAAAARYGMEISAVAAADAARIAVRSGHGTRTFGELNGNANRIAHLLRASGVQAGDAVALVCGNRPEFADVRFAAHRLGVRLTPVNWHLDADEVRYIVDDCEAKALFADVRIGEAATAAAGGNARLRTAIAIGGSIDKFTDYDEAVASHSASDIAEPVLGTVMAYTSGTTGRPKGVLRKQPDPDKAADMQALLTAVFRFEPDSGTDMTLATGPLYHAGPFNLCLTTPLTAGIGTVMMDKWTAEESLALIERYRITHSFFVPTMFQRMLALPGDVRRRYDVSSLRFVIHGAAPCPVEVKRRMLDWFGPVIWEIFAGTEGPGTIVGPEEWLDKPGTVGKPAPGGLRITDEDGNDVEPGGEGQVWLLNPPESSFEYFKAPEKTRSAQRDGFFTAGDIGYVDEDGYLFLTGRSAEVIIAGGVNIYPQEIDDVLCAHDVVADAACVGVPNEEYGEEVKAVVAAADGIERSDALAADLVAFCAAHLAKHKVPRSVDFVDEIPRSAAGKVCRRALRDRYWSGRDSKI